MVGFQLQGSTETSLRSDLVDRQKLSPNHLKGKSMMKEFLNFSCKPYSFMFHMNTEIDHGSLCMSKINNLQEEFQHMYE